MSMSRAIQISTTLGPGVFLMRRFSNQEELGRLSECHVELLSERHDIKAESLLGTSVTVSLELLGGGAPRYFNGYVTRFSVLGETRTPAYKSGRGYVYQLSVRPWLWFLTRTSTCQIFQNMTVPEVIRKVLDRSAFSKISNYELRLSGHYEKWENCVQYRETDFNFVSRLMEQEGIYYFFEHADGKHTLVLADSIGAHSPHPDLAEIEFSAGNDEALAERYYVTAWDANVEIQSGRYAIKDFDFEKPKVDLSKAKDLTRNHGLASLEVFDYPGEYTIPAEGQHYADTRVHELQWQYEVCQATSDARVIEAGRKLSLTSHPVTAQNREYLIIASYLDVSENADASGAEEAVSCQCSFRAMPTGVAEFRPPRVTPKPIVQGPQTAIVVGPGGEEIYTDKYGRVKVQFHWDRYGQSDENSSCWIRVSQPWAGKNWGAVALPRIGQEVIVSFLEGDPDWPIITGRVYNADQMPPYGLPDNKTQTGIKSRSSPGGGTENFNEIRFEDKKGEEQIYIHAEKNLDSVVELDESRKVGQHRTTEVAVDETVKVGNNRKETVGVDETIDIGANRTTTIGSNEKLSVTGNRSVAITGNDDLSVTGNRDTVVNGNLSMSVTGKEDRTVTGGQNVSVTGAINISSVASISLSVGPSNITINPSGVTITAPMIKLN